MVHDPNALRALLGMQALSNQAGPTGDPFVAKRKAQILSGDDLLAESEVEQRRKQMAEPTLGLSREQYRDDSISKLKQHLGMNAIAAQQKLAQEAAGEQVKGEYDLRGREISNQGQMNVARTYADQRAATAEANAAAQSQLLDKFMSGADPNRSMSVSGVGSIGAPPRPPSAAATSIPAPLYKAVDEAKAGYESYANNPLARMLFGNGRNSAYTSALTNLLDKKGTLAEVEEVFGTLQGVEGATIDEKIANSGIPGLQSLDPYERQYLSLKLGQ